MQVWWKEQMMLLSNLIKIHSTVKGEAQFWQFKGTVCPVSL